MEAENQSNQKGHMRDKKKLHTGVRMGTEKRARPK